MTLQYSSFKNHRHVSVLFITIAEEEYQNTAGWMTYSQCTLGSALGPMLGIECGKVFTFTFTYHPQVILSAAVVLLH